MEDARDALVHVLYIEVVLSTCVSCAIYEELQDFIEGLRLVSCPLDHTKLRRLCCGWNLFAVHSNDHGWSQVVTRSGFDQLLREMTTQELRAMVQGIYAHYRFVQQRLVPGAEWFVHLDTLFSRLAQDEALTQDSCVLLAASISAQRVPELSWLPPAVLLERLGADEGILTLSRFVCGMVRLCGEGIAALAPALLSDIPAAAPESPESPVSSPAHVKVSLELVPAASQARHVHVHPTPARAREELQKVLNQTPGLYNSTIVDEEVTPAMLASLLDAISAHRKQHGIMRIN